MAKRQKATGRGEGKGGGRDKSGQTKKAGGGKKGKETPSIEVSSALPLPAKTISAMMKRGEEKSISKYCGKLKYHLLSSCPSTCNFKCSFANTVDELIVYIPHSLRFCTDNCPIPLSLTYIMM